MSEAPRATGLQGLSGDDPFYVGYLPTPRAMKRAALLAAGSLVAMLAVLGAAAPMALRDPGPAVWDLSQQVQETGVLRLEPYPHLVQTDASGRETERLLLGEEFKTGVGDRLDRMSDGAAGSLDGRTMTASGWVLTREGRRMITLDPSDQGLKVEPGAASESIPRDGGTLETVTLSGEILDGKCYLGAMKPGDGAAHRACAMLCLRGGLPALFIERGGPNDGRVHWIADADGGGIDPALIPHVAQPVTLVGRIETLGTASVLRVDRRETR